MHRVHCPNAQRGWQFIVISELPRNTYAQMTNLVKCTTQTHCEKMKQTNNYEVRRGHSYFDNESGVRALEPMGYQEDFR